MYMTPAAGIVGSLLFPLMTLMLRRQHMAKAGLAHVLHI